MNLKSKLAIITLVILAGCFPKEDAVKPVPRENFSQSVSAGEFKNSVVFYSLEKKGIVAEIEPIAWDFYVDEKVIRLNYFRSMRAAKVNKSWHEIADTNGLDFSYLTYGLESGMGMWELEDNQMYVIDYGLDNNNEPIGLEVVKIERLEDEVRIWHAKVGVAYEVYESVSETSFYYNLRDKSIVSLPKEDEYDLAFGKYTDFVTFDGTSQDYLLYGALMGDASAVRIDKQFDEVSVRDFDSAQWNGLNKVSIGWEWKTFDLDNGYEVDANSTYLVRSVSGFKYKLRFVSFYNNVGESGHPTFEFKLL